MSFFGLSGQHWPAISWQGSALAAFCSLRLYYSHSRKLRREAAETASHVFALGLWLLSPLLNFFGVFLAAAALLVAPKIAAAYLASLVRSCLAALRGSLHARGCVWRRCRRRLAGDYGDALHARAAAVMQAFLIALPLNIRPPAWLEAALRWTMRTGRPAASNWQRSLLRHSLFSTPGWRVDPPPFRGAVPPS